LHFVAVGYSSSVIIPLNLQQNKNRKYVLARYISSLLETSLPLLGRLHADLFIIAYVDSSLVGTGQVDKAAIYSKSGDSTWAISKGFQVPSPENATNKQLSGPEVLAICKGFDDNDALFGSGMKIGGQKYFTIRADDRVLQGRKVLSSLLY